GSKLLDYSLLWRFTSIAYKYHNSLSGAYVEGLNSMRKYLKNIYSVQPERARQIFVLDHVLDLQFHSYLKQRHTQLIEAQKKADKACAIHADCNHNFTTHIDDYYTNVTKIAYRKAVA